MRMSDWSSDVCSSDLLEEWGHDVSDPGGDRPQVTDEDGAQQVGLVVEHLDQHRMGAGVADDRLHQTDDRVGYHRPLERFRQRSEERRGGKEWFSTCRSRWPPHL